MVLEGAVEYMTARGGAQQLEALYVKGKMVRYVHLAPRVNVGRTIQRHVRAHVSMCENVGIRAGRLGTPFSLINHKLHTQLDSLNVQARRFQRARLRPQLRVPGQHAPLLPGGVAGDGGAGGRGVIQVALPRPPPDAVLPGEF